MKLTPQKLLQNNRSWAGKKLEQDPGFFERLSEIQNPRFLWIGCSDSRVPANEIVGLDPGSIFVHRNVGNLVHAADWNVMTVLQFAVERLSIPHIIVCGHYGCAGVAHAAKRFTGGLLDNWLQPIRDLVLKHAREIEDLESDKIRFRRLCELNVRAQVLEVCRTSIVQNAWYRGKKLAVHGWIYGVEDGHIRDLHCTVSRAEDIDPVYRFEQVDLAHVRKKKKT